MRKRYRTVALGVAAVLLALLLWYFFRPAEPHYRGEPLSYWVLANARRVEPDAFDPRKAIAGIGAKGVPYLIQWSRKRSHGWQRWLRTHRNGKGLFHQWIPYEMTGIDEENQAKAAMQAFKCLGPQGRSAIAYLAAWAANPTNKFMADEAIEALCSVGPEALPTLLTLLSTGQIKAHPRLINYLGESNNPEAVTGLMNCLTQTNEIGVSMAIEALGKLKLEPSRVVPALMQCLDQAPRVRPQWQPDVRFSIVSALKQFGTNAEAATGPLLVHLEGQDADPAFSCLLMTTLVTINPQPVAIVPVLTNYVQSPDRLVRRCAVQVLSDLGPRAEAALPSLTNALHFADTRPIVTAAIRRIAGDWPARP